MYKCYALLILLFVQWAAMGSSLVHDVIHIMMVRRLERVLGWKDRVDELVVSLPERSSAPCTTLFFGGDIQDLKDRMLVRPQTKKFAEEHCLESVCQILRTAFRYDSIVLVRPTDVFEGVFSRFSNWLDCDPRGNPGCSPLANYASLFHLENIIKGLDGDGVGLLGSNIRLIGFSKGCVVLNQLLFELSSRPPDPFTSKIVSMIWLDGGHGGNKNTWLTDHNVLQSFRKYYPHIDIDVRMTPYQLSKPRVAHEEGIFRNILKDYEFFKRTCYFENDSSIEAHFDVIKTLLNER